MWAAVRRNAERERAGAYARLMAEITRWLNEAPAHFGGGAPFDAALGLALPAVPARQFRDAARAAREAGLAEWLRVRNAWARLRSTGPNRR